MSKRCDVNNLSIWFGYGSGQPVDLPLLNKLYGTYFLSCHSYINLQEAVATYARERCGHDERRSRERKIDLIVARMTAPILEELQSAESKEVLWFLAELRVERSGEPVRCKRYAAANAMALAHMVMFDAADEWRDLRRFHRNSPVPAWEKFYESIMPKLPSSQEIWSIMVLEYALARKVLLKEQRESRRRMGE